MFDGKCLEVVEYYANVFITEKPIDDIWRGASV